MARTTGGKGRVVSGAGEPTRRGRPVKGLKAVTLKLAPEQHQALQDAVRRAGLERKPNVGEGASFIVRELVQSWIDRGSRWPD
jgi:hypothetical protein